MATEITFTVDDDLIAKLDTALGLNNESLDEALDGCIRSYISKALYRAAEDIQNNPRVAEVDEFYGKAIAKIPKWACKPNQYNHKIIRAFLMAQDIAGTVTLQMMEQICSDETREDVYCPTFKSNFAQMKYDNATSHGKVFEDNGRDVWLWDQTNDIVMEYASLFYRAKQED